MRVYLTLSIRVLWSFAVGKLHSTLVFIGDNFSFVCPLQAGYGMCGERVILPHT
jgi:hypothetical protein